MSNEKGDGTFGQAVQTLVIVNQQEPTAEALKTLHGGYLAHLVMAAVRGVLPSLDAFDQAIGILPAVNILFTLTSDGRTAGQLISCIQTKRQVSGYAKDVMSKAQFAKELTSDVIYKLVGIRGDEFSDQERATKNIFAEGARRKCRKPPAFLAALLREKFSQEELGSYVAVMHEPICDSHGFPRVLVLRCCGGEEWLNAWIVNPEGRWDRGGLFLFLAPQE